MVLICAMETSSLFVLLLLLRGFRAVHAEECPSDCRLWMAESSLFSHQLGLFAGVDLEEGAEILEEADVLVPLYDVNDQAWSPLDGIRFSSQVQVDLILQSDFVIESFAPGIASSMLCLNGESTVELAQNYSVSYDSTGVHRSKDPTAGSFSYRQSGRHLTTTPVKAGRELFAKCDKRLYTLLKQFRFTEHIKQYMKKPVSTLQQEGICVDNLLVRTSTIPNIGKGAFSKRRVSKGGTIASSPMIPLERKHMDIFEISINRLGRMQYPKLPKGQQLLLNYCFGHPNSTTLLLPYAPGVNYINHNHQEPNAIVDWSRSALMDKELLQLTAEQLKTEWTRRTGQLVVDYIALRDIEPGEEIFLDYGPFWQKGWKAFNQYWNPPDGSDAYTSAVEYRIRHPDNYIRTVDEQREMPYPDNIVTVCFFTESTAGENEEVKITKDRLDRNNKHFNCLRPCTILERYEKGNLTFYDVQVDEGVSYFLPDECILSQESMLVKNMSATFIQLADKEYTSDQHMPSSFRHEIGIGDHMYPDAWMMEGEDPMGDFLPDSPLAPGQIEQIKWKEDQSVVTENAYVMGLSPRVRKVLLEYCDWMGITERFRDLTIRGNPLSPGDDEKVILNGLNWFVQRPESRWNSNMHWISPNDAKSQEHYLQALSAAGFDEVLQQIGQKFGMTGLAAYHVTFIAVSHCAQGFSHTDVTDTGNKVFNVIIPLILANETGPELEVYEDESSDPLDMGRLRYQYDVASMMGDGAIHATAAVDYRANNEMRMAATVYVADINKDNIEEILKDYTQAYPPQDEPEILLQMAGTHWKLEDHSVALPKPGHDWLKKDSVAGKEE